MSNLSFKINSEINSSSIIASDIKTSSITCDRLEYSGDLPTISPNGGNYVFTLTELSLMGNRNLMLVYDSKTSATVLSFGGIDSSAEAVKLLTLFNLTDLTTKRLIKVTRLSGSIGNDYNVNFGTHASSCKYIQTFLRGAGPNNNNLLSAAGTVRDCYIFVSKIIPSGTGVVAGESGIKFDVINTGG